MSGWGLVKASAGSRRLRANRERQPLGQPGHSGKKISAPSKQSWLPLCTDMGQTEHVKKKSDFMHLASKCWPLKRCSCWQNGLSVPLISRSMDLLRWVDTRVKGEISKECKVDGNSWDRSREKLPEIKTRQKMDKMVEQEWNIMEQLLHICFRKGHTVLQKEGSAWGWEVTVGKQRHKETKRQIQRSPTHTTNATPLLALEVTQEGRMVNQQHIKGEKRGWHVKDKTEIVKTDRERGSFVTTIRSVNLIFS